MAIRWRCGGRLNWKAVVEVEVGFDVRDVGDNAVEVVAVAEGRKWIEHMAVVGLVRLLGSDLESSGK